MTSNDTTKAEGQETDFELALSNFLSFLCPDCGGEQGDWDGEYWPYCEKCEVTYKQSRQEVNQ